MIQEVPSFLRFISFAGYLMTLGHLDATQSNDWTVNDNFESIWAVAVWDLSRHYTLIGAVRDEENYEIELNKGPRFSGR
jgi:hypothetical protein